LTPASAGARQIVQARIVFEFGHRVGPAMLCGKPASPDTSTVAMLPACLGVDYQVDLRLLIPNVERNRRSTTIAWANEFWTSCKGQSAMVKQCF
jgi:hypothetical protein